VIYLVAGLVMWLVRALLPTVLVLLVGAVLLWLGRRAPGFPVRGVGAVIVVAALAVLAWQTRTVRREFTHPQITMFRRHIADPIPASVRNLAPGSPAPLVFHSGAVVAFDAPESMLRSLLDHSLPGSTALAALAELKSRNGRDTTTVIRVGAVGAPGYLQLDSTAFPADLLHTFPGAHSRAVEALRRGLNVYVLAEVGDWGRFESVVTYEPQRQRVHLRQYIVRAPIGPDGRR
jgi:hypothetical protein